MPSVSSGLLGGDNWDEAKLAAASSDSDSEAAYPGRRQASWKSEPARIVSRLRSWLRLSSHGAQNPGPTAYLDGLRGFAALLVYWHHHELWVRNPFIFENAFGFEGNFYFATLPGVRTFFTGGHYSVTVFFVLSGYVLSIKPLSLIEKGDFAGLSEHLASPFSGASSGCTCPSSPSSSSMRRHGISLGTGSTRGRSRRARGWVRCGRSISNSRTLASSSRRVASRG